MPQVSLSTSTNFDGDLNALVEDQGTALTVRFDLDEPAPAGGLKVYVDSEVEQIINRLDLPGFASSPTTENIDFTSFVTNFDNSGFALTIKAGATFGTFTINVFDNPEPDTFLPETFDGLAEVALSLRTQEQVDEADQGDITGLGEYTIDPGATSSTVTFVDEASQLTEMPEPPTPEPPAPDGLQVSLFTGPGYLIEDEGTVSAHAFLATNGVIPEGGLLVSVNAPNLSEFDLESVSVEGGEIAAVRDGGFDLLMTEYTTLVNLAIADDGETEVEETATFSLAAGDGYEVVEDYSGGTFELVDTRSDIPQGIVVEPNDIATVATDTGITPENPTFSATDSIYFNIGNRYLNEDGTYTYIDFNEEVDLYQVNLSGGDTVAVELFEVEGNMGLFDIGFLSSLTVFDADGNQLLASLTELSAAAPDKLFGTANNLGDAFNEDGTVNFDETESYLEFTAPKDGSYYIGVSDLASATPTYAGQSVTDVGFTDVGYSIETPGLGDNNRLGFGNYNIEIDLLTPDNPRKTGMPTPPVSNPNVTNPPTLSLEANPTTDDSEGNVIPGVVEFVEDGGISRVDFVIRAEGEIPEEGIEIVLNSNVNLFDYVSLVGQDSLPSTIGGQFLSTFYNEEGIPTGMRLRIEEPTMTVDFEAANRLEGFPIDFTGMRPFLDAYEPLETDGAEDVTFFLQAGEGYEIAPDAGTAEVTYYDSVEDVPAATGGGGDTVPEVGITISETELIETEGTETTLTFTLSEPPPAEGLTVFLDSDDNTLIGSPISQFDVLDAEFSGGSFPLANADASGFFFNITEQTATITLSVFDELTVDTGLPEDTFQEGLLGLTFALQPQLGYTIDPSASEVSLSIQDNPASQILVTPTAATVDDASSTTLIESENTVGLLNLSLGALPSAEGLTVSVGTDSLADFDQGAIEVEGGTIAAVRDDGFDVTITEREATVSLPILDDGMNEDSETATFRIEPSDSYETVQIFNEVTFLLSDTPGQVSAPEEIEGNSTLSEANSLGLSADNAATSVKGNLGGVGEESGGDFLGYAEDVDFYSFTLEAGQAISLDIDSLEDSSDVLFYPEGYLFQELVGIPQQLDAELRLFDAAGNELAANNDGAAPDEEFSRDPFIQYTAETAGTYYVGVSQLGNRNYDPNVEFSGSGWTFPEVGVLFGSYELIATITEGNTPPLTGDLTGTDAADTLVGDAGHNILNGLLGDDIYTGGAGADQFVLGLAQGVDTITDFEVGVDQIKLGGLTPNGVRFFELGDDTLVLTNSNELIGVVQGVTGLDSVFA
ncbi:MAG: DVUA0089 family protein [Leptolyngbyaceae cyanobacterium]